MTSQPNTYRVHVEPTARSANHAVQSARAHQFAAADETLGRVTGIILRYGVVLQLLFWGAFKFTAVEAAAIQPLVANSPLMGWLYEIGSQQAVSTFIGVSELAFAFAIAARSLSPRVCALGSAGAALTFVITLTFLVTTPGMWQPVPGFPLPVPNELGAFIAKDVLLLGASLWSAGEALRAIRP